MLSAIDPATAQRLHVNDRKRIIRAIEIFEQTGQTASAHGGDFSNARGEEIEFEPIIAALCFPTERSSMNALSAELTL